jgi:hypothetical protein
VGDVNEYMVERYFPGISAGQLDEASGRLAAAAMELATQASRCATSPRPSSRRRSRASGRSRGAAVIDVRRARERAGVPFARIVETHDFSPNKEGQ